MVNFPGDCRCRGFKKEKIKINMKTLLFILLGVFASAQCPNFIKSQSNPYYLLFSSNTGIPSTGQPKVISGLNFVDSGHWVSSGIHYASWTNTSGQPLDINNFTIQFGSLTCNYSNSTLGVLDTVKALKSIPNNRKYKVYSVDGKFLQSGITSQNFYFELPKNQNMIVNIEGYMSLKIKVN